MAKITELPSLSEKPAINDILIVNDTSTNLTKSITAANLMNILNVDSYGGLEDAVTAIGATEMTVVISSAQTLTGNLTIPSTLSIEIVKGGSIDGAHTLTVNGPFNAGLYQVFGSLITVAFAGAEIIDVIPHWFESDPYTNGFSAINKALKSAIVSGTRNGLRSVYIPAGDYAIDTTGVFSDIDVTYRVGVKIRGAGWNLTRLILNPSGSDLWFYNNISTATLQFAIFEDIGFYGELMPAYYATVSDNVKGFRIHSDGHEQGFKFIHCNFIGLHTGFHIEGTNCASEMTWVNCRITHIKDVVLYLNNLQTFNHTFISTDIEVIWGDFVRVGPEGGGAVKAYGGSWIAYTGATFSGLDEYIIDIPISAAMGYNSSIFTFNGVRFENVGNNAKLVNSNGAAGVLHAVFRDCIFWSSGVTAVKTGWVNISNYKIVNFDRCVFTWADTTKYETYILSSVTQYGHSGNIKWNNCLIHDDLSEHISFSNNYGRASATGCYGHSCGVVLDMFASDFDLFGMDAFTTNLIGGKNDGGFGLKTISIMYQSYFPFNNTNETSVKLPKNALIKSIYVQKHAQGASGSDYCLHVGNNDKTIIYASSIPEDEQYVHKIDYKRGSTSIAKITTRTDDDTATLQFQGGNHSISTDDTVNVNWVSGGPAGRRRAMTITSITMTTQGYIQIILDGGTGDNLPAVNSDCYLSSILGFINVGATDNERIVRLWSSNGDGSSAGGTGAHTGGYAIVEYY